MLWSTLGSPSNAGRTGMGGTRRTHGVSESAESRKHRPWRKVFFPLASPAESKLIFNAGSETK